MEPAQATSRRRRRWLIVTFVLVLVSMVAWWNWPRGDARFVGKWNMHTSEGDVLQVLTFSKSGRIDCFVPHRDEHEPTRSYWVEADKLLFADSNPFFVLIGQSQTIEHHFTVVAEDEIRLEQPGFDGPFVTTLRRIPE